MKRIYTLVFVLFAITAFSQKQDYNQMISAGTYTVEEIREAAETYFENRDKGKGSGYKQYKRWEYQAMRSMKDNGVLKSPKFYFEELERYNKSINQKAARAKAAVADPGNWEQLGPYSENASSSDSPGTGKVMALAVDKTNVNHIIAASETGGVWKSINAGVSWTPLTDNMSNLRVNSLAIDPTNSSIYYWGSNNGIIFKSTDAGATWNVLATVTPGAGIVNKILVDPSNTAKLYCSVENKGIYKSTNSGISWLAISSILTSGYDVEFKPMDYNTVYASGEYFLRSTDGGATFSLNEPGIDNWEFEYAPASVNGSNVPWYIASRNKEAFGIEAVFAATGNGLGRFNTGTDNVAGNKTKLVSVPLDLSVGDNPVLKFLHAESDYFGSIDKLKVFYKSDFFDPWVELASYSGDIQGWVSETIPLPNPSFDYYIAFEGETAKGGSIVLDDVLVQTDNGPVLTEGFEGESSNVFRTLGAKMIAVSEIDPTVVYLAEASKPSTQSAYFEAIYKSTDSGEKLKRISQTKNFFGSDIDGDGTRGQAPHHMDIAVSQTDANVVFLGGVNTWRSLDGGLNFSLASHWERSLSTSRNAGYTHADICIMEAVGSKVYLGTDGGFYVANTPSATMSPSFYTDLSSGLGIRQFYRFGISQTDPVVITGGAQDNGSSGRTAAGVWRDWLSADGGEGFVDKNNSNILYGTQQGGIIRKTTDVNQASIAYISGTPDGSGSFITPMEQDPILPNTFYVGIKHVYKTSDDGDNWTAISQQFGGNLFELKVAPSNNLILYASGASTVGLNKTTTGGGTWEKLNSYNGGFITSIAVHPTNPNKVAVTTEGAEKIYVTTDGGTTWTSYKFDLPNFSALAVVWDNNGNDGLYIGMDYGVYYTDNTLSNTWEVFNNNLPNVKISELEVNYVDNKLYTATFGRGVWRTPRFNIVTLGRESADIQLKEVSLYPNPATDSFSLISSKKETVNIKVFNSLGKLMHYSKDITLVNAFKIDVSEYTAGLYYVRINNKEHVVVKKLVVYN
ncbi:T9SS type A sorting domain-containing protein [Algibacter amylolyticus]|uniref:T9SS type A sorting domain-containing protein n=1 Tax=Algibacter amylolyticus TaxID=1608400 RepID=A0A5M7B767_9FLAO|nr:T9SS type A sorting domain-containing protein [Algibacter amylolyticus]KAA5823331.1 T9SS type A sorting domain-containing protein [Algibacter amylolyticus]MBB5267473.1 photosystem II stability/assembly factor-like uncharacterized protein [Algibacter amylolyticus]TSJ73819.1 T9SS type A sorting domain-containing protein [Algibacter amylolyticus]